MSSRSILQIARPTLGEAEADAAHQAILSGWVTQGPSVEAFEKEFAAMVGAKHAVAVANCTAALHMPLFPDMTDADADRVIESLADLA